MNSKTLQIAGFITSGLGLAVGFLSGVIEDKKLDLKIADAVNEALKNAAENK